MKRATVTAYWWQRDQAALPPAPTLIEREPEAPKPVLYDNRGRPLTWPQRERRMGFRPPHEVNDVRR